MDNEVNPSSGDVVTKQTESPADSGRTLHGEQRAQEARKGDTHRNVGDVNRIKREGKRYEDTGTGNIVYVSGNKIYAETPDGREVSQFHNSRSNTQWRIRTGRWKPAPLDSRGSSSDSNN